MKREEDMDKYDEDIGFVVLPKGEYYAEIYTAKDQRSNAGNDMVQVSYKILIPEEYKNARVFEYLTFTEKSMGRVKHFLHMINEPFKGNIQIDSGNWIGKCIKLVVSVENHETYGEQNRVTAHLPYDPAWEKAYKAETKARSKEQYHAKKNTSSQVAKDKARDEKEREFGEEMAKKNEEDIPF